MTFRTQLYDALCAADISYLSDVSDGLESNGHNIVGFQQMEGAECISLWLEGYDRVIAPDTALIVEDGEVEIDDEGCCELTPFRPEDFPPNTVLRLQLTMERPITADDIRSLTD